MRQKNSSMHDCNWRLGWEESQESTKVLTTDAAPSKPMCPYFLLISPPPSINTPIEDTGCAPAQPTCGISSSWKPESYIVSSLTHLDGTQMQPHQEPDLSLPSWCYRMCRFAVNLHGLDPAAERKLKTTKRTSKGCRGPTLLASTQLGSALRSESLMILRLQLHPQHTQR